jgi:hypothetical protein
MIKGEGREMQPQLSRAIVLRIHRLPTGFIWFLYIASLLRLSNVLPRQRSPNQRLGQAFTRGFKECLHGWSDEVPRMRHFISTASPHPQFTMGNLPQQNGTITFACSSLPVANSKPRDRTDRRLPSVVFLDTHLSFSTLVAKIYDIARRLGVDVFAASGGIHNDEMGLSDSAGRLCG